MDDKWLILLQVDVAEVRTNVRSVPGQQVIDCPILIVTDVIPIL